MYDFLIVGAGFSGCVLAERLAAAGKKVLLLERRKHAGGNAYDYYDENGILIHKYGPHWFHTNSEKIVAYLSQFSKWREHKHIVKSSVNGKLYPFPVNRKTINLFFGLNLTTEQEAKDFLESKKIKFRLPPQNAEEMALSLVGKELYETFYKDYTEKQWGTSARNLSPSVTARIPVRFDENEYYFNDKFMLMPENGYAELFNKICASQKIELALETEFSYAENSVKFDKLIYTGALDEFFDFAFGELPYRSLRFENKHLKEEFFQSCQQINYPDKNKFTRIIEWKHATKQKTAGTTITYEFPEKFEKAGERFYPVPAETSEKIASRYKAEAQKLKSVYFIGRLAEYKYYNMDQVIAKALALAEKLS